MSALQYRWETHADGHRIPLFSFLPCEREPREWKEEIYAAARSVANRTKKPLWVCSSGGIDSEIACRAFFEQGIHFSVLTLEYENGINRHDIQYATKWCEAHGVVQKIVKVDIDKLLTTEADEYAEKYPAIHPFRYLQIRLMELVEELDGFAVLASGEQIYGADLDKKLLSRDDMYLIFATGNVAPLEWCKDNKTEHEPYFYFATPELCLSYTRVPLVSFALAHPESVFRHPANSYTLKRLAYQSVWPDLEIRYKADGFERIKPKVRAARERLQKRFGSSFHMYHMPVSEFVGQLTARLTPGT